MEEAADRLAQLQPKIVAFLNSGYLESIKRLRESLMMQARAPGRFCSHRESWGRGRLVGLPLPAHHDT